MTDERDPFDDILDSLGEHDDAPPPNPRFVRALRGDLMKQAAAMSAAGSLPATDDPFRGSMSAPIPLPQPRQRRLDRRLALQLAAVAVLLLAWLGTLAGGGPRSIYNAAIQTESSMGAVSMYRGNNARTGAIDEPGPAGNPHVAWTSTPAAEGFVVTNANESTILLAYEQTRRIVALDADDGHERWTFEAGCSLGDTTPLLIGGLVYLSTSCNEEYVGRLFAIGEADGKERWRRDMGNGIASSPMVDDGVVYVMATGDQLAVLALDADDGEPIWSVQVAQTPIPPPTSTAAAAPSANTPYIGKAGAFSPALGDGLLFVTAMDGAIHALDATNGREIWHFATGGNTVSTPAYRDGVVYVSSAGVTDPHVAGAFHALNAETGEVIWQASDLPDHSPYTGPVIMDGIVAVSLHSSPAPMTVAYDMVNGEERWRIESAGSMMYADGVLYLLDLQRGNALALDPATGATVWTAFIGNYQMTPSEVTHIVIDPVISEGRLIVSSLSETVLAIESTPDTANAIASPGDTAMYDFTGIDTCNPPAPVNWQAIAGEPTASLVPVDQQQRGGGPPSIHPDDLPQGEPVSPDVERAIGETIAAIKPCIERRGNADVSGFFSEDFFRRAWVQVQITHGWTPAFPNYLAVTLRESTEVNFQQLPDGRIGAEFQLSEQYGNFVVFVQDGGTWVIDEWLEVTLHPGGLG